MTTMENLNLRYNASGGQPLGPFRVGSAKSDGKEPIYENITSSNGSPSCQKDLLLPMKKETYIIANGYKTTCQTPSGNRHVFPIRGNMSVRTEIEKKLLEEICLSAKSPGLYERQRIHPAEVRYHAKKDFIKKHTTRTKRKTSSGESNSSPFIRKMNETSKHELTFFSEELNECPFLISDQAFVSQRTQSLLKRGDKELGNANCCNNKVRCGNGQGKRKTAQKSPRVEEFIKGFESTNGTEQSRSVHAGRKVKCENGRNKSDSEDKETLQKIKVYNRSMSMEAFLIKPVRKEKELEFQGVLRFYLEEQGQQISKALRLKSSTTVKQLVPLVEEKFGRQRHQMSEDRSSYRTGIFMRRSGVDIPLQNEDKPLELALSSPSRPRFVVSFFNVDANHIHYSDSHTIDCNGNGSSKDAYNRTLEYCGESEKPSLTRSSSVVSLTSMESSRTTSGDERSVVRHSRRRKKQKKEKRDRSLDRLSEQLSFRKNSLRLSRSMTNLFHKTLSLRQKENPFRKQSELSTEESAPGVLKIFGDSLIPGAEYKSILATPTSTAKELVKEALERYGISRKQVRHYVLCDVIGKFVPKAEATQEVVKKAKHYRRTEKGVWIEECLRVVSDNERPLTIQMFWKPTLEFSRRFELRKRSELVRHIDTFTCGINANARKLLLSKSKLEGTQVPQTSGINRSESTVSTDPLNESFVSVNERDVDGLSRSISVSEKSRKKAQKNEKGLVKAPAKHPYLLSLKSFDSSVDNLLFVIRERVTMVGGANGNIGEDDLCLYAPDILAEHCWISQSITEDKASIRSMTIDPLPGAQVGINGNPVTSTAQIRPGDLITIGEHYLFLYKCPSDHATAAGASTAKGTNFDLSSLRQSLETGTRPASAATDCASGHPGSLEDPDMLKWRRDRKCKYENDCSRLKLNFSIERRDDLIDCIVTIMDKYPHAPKLTMAYLVSMCVDYSLAKYDIETTRNLLSAISNTIQNVVWEATKTLADTQANINDDEQGNIHCLIRDLGTVNLWLSNAVELHYFFRKNVRDVMRMRPATPQCSNQDNESLPEEEMIANLEDVVMYCFQQAVYYLTKALYAVLPAVLESNPFVNDVSSHTDQSKQTVDTLISILHSTLTTMIELNLHPHIISQLFCYLFFFTSTSLFNMLMGKDAGKKYYRWSKGAQLRGNLDAIEAWAGASGLTHEAQIYLNKINTLANLLATPKIQLLSASWYALQRDYPSLKNEQLLKILSEYDVGHGKEQPELWVPPEGAIDPSTWSSRLLESFNNYPPLKLPKSGFTMRLNAEVHDELLADIAHHLSLEFGAVDDDRDSGLSVSQTIPVFTDVSPPQDFMDVQTESKESSLPDRLACHTGSSSSNTDLPCPIPPKRKSREERRRSPLPVHIPEMAETSSCDTATIESPPGDKSNELDLGDSGISLSFRQKDYNYDANVIYGPDDEEFSLNLNPEKHTDNCNASQAIPNKSKAISYESTRSRSWSYDRRLDPSGALVKVSHHRHSSEKHSKPHQQRPQLTIKNSDWTCTGPLAMSSPVTSDASNPHCPSPIQVAVGSIPPQPSIPAPTLDRSSLKKDKNNHDVVHDRSATTLTPIEVVVNNLTDESKVVEIKRLMPHSPDGVVNGLRVLPLSDLEEEVLASVEDCPVETDLLRTIEGDKGGRQQEEDDGLPVEEEQEDVVIVNLMKGDRGLGLGLIDGLFTPLRRPGIYVRTLVPGEPAEQDGRLQIGDRILAVNGKSLVGSDYQSAMKTIRESGTYLRFLVAKGNRSISIQITASSC